MMTAVVYSEANMRTICDVRLRARAPDVIQGDLSLALAELGVEHGSTVPLEAEASADDGGVIVVPAVVANRRPGSLVEDFHPTIRLDGAPDKANYNEQL